MMKSPNLPITWGPIDYGSLGSMHPVMGVVESLIDVQERPADLNSYPSRRLIATSASDAPIFSSSTPLPVVVGVNDTQSSLPVGAWVGIALGIAAILIAAIYYFVGNKRIREKFVSMALRKRRERAERPTHLDAEMGTFDPELVYNDCPESRWTKRPTITSTHPGDLSIQLTPRDVPFAPIDVDLDGRMSPRLPIASKQGSMSTAGTPSGTSRTHRNIE